MNTILRRHSFLQIAAAGAAATLPAAAEAATVEIPQLPQLSDQQQFDLCVDQLRSILHRLNPGREFADFVALDGACIHVRMQEGGAT